MGQRGLIVKYEIGLEESNGYVPIPEPSKLKD
jgi:hypothetical protein